MKLLCLLLLASATVILLCRCGPSKNTCQKIADTSAISLDSCHVTAYVKNYQDKFVRQNSKVHTKSIFLDTGYFRFLGDFFTDSINKYDSVSIYFLSYNELKDPSYTGQANKKQIAICLAPAHHKQGVLGVFINYLQRYPERHYQFGYPLFDPSGGNQTIQSMPDGSKNEILFPDRVTTKQYIKNYRKRFGFLWNQKHTKSICMSASEFLLLSDFFKKDTTHDYVGARVFFADYNQKIKLYKNTRKKEYTLIFVAARKESLAPAYSALPKFFEQEKSKIRHPLWLTEQTYTAVNHGELCPNGCDTTTNP
jgi:hypothetical protein